MFIQINDAVVTVIVAGVVVSLALWLRRSIRIAAGNVRIEAGGDSTDKTPVNGGS